MRKYLYLKSTSFNFQDLVKLIVLNSKYYPVYSSRTLAFQSCLDFLWNNPVQSIVQHVVMQRKRAL